MDDVTLKVAIDGSQAAEGARAVLASLEQIKEKAQEVHDMLEACGRPETLGDLVRAATDHECRRAEIKLQALRLAIDVDEGRVLTTSEIIKVAARFSAFVFGAADPGPTEGADVPQTA